MSEGVLPVIPTDPHWQPEPEPATGERAAALVRELASGVPGAEDRDLDDVEPDVDRYELPRAVDCGRNLVRVGCPAFLPHR
ncbi:hypothetical protein [Streptomyces sp. NPDC001450]